MNTDGWDIEIARVMPMKELGRHQHGRRAVALARLMNYDAVITTRGTARWRPNRLMMHLTYCTPVVLDRNGRERRFRAEVDMARLSADWADGQSAGSLREIVRYLMQLGLAIDTFFDRALKMETGVGVDDYIPGENIIDYLLRVGRGRVYLL